MNALKTTDNGVQRVQRGATCSALLVFYSRFATTQRNAQPYKGALRVAADRGVEVLPTKGLDTMNLQNLAKSRLVAVNDRGQRIGQDHPRAVLTDAEVDLLLELRSEGKSLAWLGDKFGVHKGTAAKICRGDRRGQTAADWRCARVACEQS